MSRDADDSAYVRQGVDEHARAGSLIKHYSLPYVGAAYVPVERFWATCLKWLIARDEI